MLDPDTLVPLQTTRSFSGRRAVRDAYASADTQIRAAWRAADAGDHRAAADLFDTAAQDYEQAAEDHERTAERYERAAWGRAVPAPLTARAQARASIAYGHSYFTRAVHELYHGDPDAAIHEYARAFEFFHDAANEPHAPAALKSGALACAAIVRGQQVTVSAATMPDRRETARWIAQHYYTQAARTPGAPKRVVETAQALMAALEAPPPSAPHRSGAARSPVRSSRSR